MLHIHARVFDMSVTIQFDHAFKNIGKTGAFHKCMIRSLFMETQYRRTNDDRYEQLAYAFLFAPLYI